MKVIGVITENWNLGLFLVDAEEANHALQMFRDRVPSLGDSHLVVGDIEVSDVQADGVKTLGILSGEKLLRSLTR